MSEPVATFKPRELFTVEYPDGEMVDEMGNGGFSVFLSREMAEELASEAEGEGVRVVRYVEAAE